MVQVQIPRVLLRVYTDSALCFLLLTGLGLVLLTSSRPCLGFSRPFVAPGRWLQFGALVGSGFGPCQVLCNWPPSSRGGPHSTLCHRDGTASWTAGGDAITPCWGTRGCPSTTTKADKGGPPCANYFFHLFCSFPRMCFASCLFCVPSIIHLPQYWPSFAYCDHKIIMPIISWPQYQY